MARELPKEILLIDVWANCAKELARVGACERAQVACILTPPDLSLPIGVGYNGPASGLPNKCARPDEPGNCGCVHAEANACIKAPVGPKWAFITIPPCERCAAMMVNAGVECVVYSSATAHRGGLHGGMDLLDRLGITHGTPEQIIEQLLNMSVEEESTDSRVLGQEPWEAEDFMAAKAQTSRFADE
jgi:deoxycytidylate deaminase